MPEARSNPHHGTVICPSTIRCSIHVIAFADGLQAVDRLITPPPVPVPKVKPARHPAAAVPSQAAREDIPVDLLETLELLKSHPVVSLPPRC